MQIEVQSELVMSFFPISDSSSSVLYQIKNLLNNLIDKCLCISKTLAERFIYVEK